MSVGNSSGSESTRPPFWLAILALFAFAALIAVIAYLGGRLETIEDRLRFRADGSSALDNGEVIDPTQDAATGGLVYVPVYSHIYGKGGKPFLLETTLSVRNTDTEGSLVLTRVEFYGSDGKLLGSRLEAPRSLPPLATRNFLVKQRETEGGSGANFLVEWTADRIISEPVVEAVMISVDHGVSFMSPGRPVPDR